MNHEMEPHLKISTAFYIKNYPKEHIGMTQETWTFGNDPTKFSNLMFTIVYRSLDFALRVGIINSAKEINSELEILCRLVGELKVTDTGESE